MAESTGRTLEEARMGKVGRLVTDPKTGAYCQITLDSGEKILVNHDRASVNSGQLTVEQTKWMGLNSDRVFSLDLASPEGQAALRRLTAGATEESGRGTPLGAFVAYLQDAPSVEEVRRRCTALHAARETA
jgi:hypothetical protein